MGGLELELWDERFGDPMSFNLPVLHSQHSCHLMTQMAAPAPAITSTFQLERRKVMVQGMFLVFQGTTWKLCTIISDHI